LFSRAAYASWGLSLSSVFYCYKIIVEIGIIKLTTPCSVFLFFGLYSFKAGLVLFNLTNYAIVVLDR